MTAIAALFTAVSAVSGQMSGGLNGSAARFAAHINVLIPFERRFGRRRRSFLPGLKIQAEFRAPPGFCTPQKNRRMGGAAAGGKVHSGYSGDRKTLL